MHVPLSVKIVIWQNPNPMPLFAGYLCKKAGLLLGSQLAKVLIRPISQALHVFELCLQAAQGPVGLHH